MTVSGTEFKRRPLSYIEAKLNRVQAEAILSVQVEPYDLIVKASENQPKPQAKQGRTRSACYFPSKTPYRYSSPKENTVKSEEESPAILYKLHHAGRGGHQGPINVKKYVWDPETMRYIGSGMTARRAVSAPPVTAEPHLNSLFKAAQESSRVGVMGQIRRAKTAVASRKWERNIKEAPQTTSQRTSITYNSPRSDITSDSDSPRDEWTGPAGLEMSGKRITPLSFDQAALVNKVIRATDDSGQSTEESQNITTAVIFNKEYKPKVYSHPKSVRRPEGFRVHQETTETEGLCGRKTPITKLSIAHSKHGEVESQRPEAENLSYEDILAMSAPIATMNTDHNSSDSGSPQRHPSEASDKRSLHIPDQYHRLHSHNPHRQLRPKSKYGAPTLKQNQSETNRVKTPKVPDEVRAHIRRQCTMPSYAVMAKPQERTRDDKKDSASDTHRDRERIVVERLSGGKERVKSPTKPAFCPPSQRVVGRKSVPTITQNGPEGSKVFMSITLSKGTIINKHKTKKGHPKERALHSAPPDHSFARQELFSQMNPNVKPGTPALKESTGKLSEKKPLIQRNSSRSLIRSKSALDEASNTDVTLSRSQAVTDVTLSRSQAIHVDVNIPTGEEFSVMSSANFESSLSSSDGIDRSCDLNDVRSENSEDLREPTPLPPEPEVETTEAMKDRIHRDLMKTISDTDQYLQAMDHKRRNKPPQIVYSDDEDLIADKKETDIAIPAVVIDDRHAMHTKAGASHEGTTPIRLHSTSHLDINQMNEFALSPEATLSSQHKTALLENDREFSGAIDSEDHRNVTDEDLIDEDSFDPREIDIVINLPDSYRPAKRSSKQFLEMVHQFEENASMIGSESDLDEGGFSW